MPLRRPDSTHGPYAEKTTRVITANVLDENGTPIPGASLTTMTWDLYDEETLITINSRAAVDVKANVSAGGVLTLELLPADMVITVATKGEEKHRSLLVWTYNSGTRRGSYEAQIHVQNVERVT